MGFQNSNLNLPLIKIKICIIIKLYVNLYMYFVAGNFELHVTIVSLCSLVHVTALYIL